MARQADVTHAEKAILVALKRGPIDPADLVAKLEGPLPQIAVREAIWRLLDAGQVELTAKRLLSLSQVAA